MQVYKRNGEVENFDKNKIITAINKAFVEVDGILYETDTAEDIADAIERFVGLNNYPVPIEKIQDRIEEYLMRSERLDVARAYIRYRYKRDSKQRKRIHRERMRVRDNPERRGRPRCSQRQEAYQGQD